MTDLDLTGTEADLAANAIRFLAVDAVQKANSGHPGMPMGMADIAVTLWGRHLVVDPDDPEWPDRDRFVVSNGHGSMLLYAVLHLAGFGIDIEDITNFRQLGSPTPGHPEIERHLGIETTTGPLGQGFGTAVGMALAEERLRAEFGSDLVDHMTYGFVSDGDMMEGVASEAASLAGHLALGRLVLLYDDNQISLEGPTAWTFTEDVPQRFAAYGWHTATVDGHDRLAVDEAITAAQAGKGSPVARSRARRTSATAAPIGRTPPPPTDRRSARTRWRWCAGGWGGICPRSRFPTRPVGSSPPPWSGGGRRGRPGWSVATPPSPPTRSVAARWLAFHEPPPVHLDPPAYAPGKEVATRAMSGDVIQQLAELRPDLLTGDADLAGSTKSLVEACRRLLRRRSLGPQHPLRGA